MVTPEQRKVYRARWRAKNKGRIAEAQRRYREKWPEKLREKRRQVWRDWNKAKGRYLGRYGIDIAAYNALLAQQLGLCAICRNPPAKKRLGVDHDHATGRVRGLLCDSCNVGIGRLGDTLAGVERAASYLQAHERRQQEAA